VKPAENFAGIDAGVETLIERHFRDEYRTLLNDIPTVFENLSQLLRINILMISDSESTQYREEGGDYLEGENAIRDIFFPVVLVPEVGNERPKYVRLVYTEQQRSKRFALKYDQETRNYEFTDLSNGNGIYGQLETRVSILNQDSDSTDEDPVLLESDQDIDIPLNQNNIANLPSVMFQAGQANLVTLLGGGNIAPGILEHTYMIPVVQRPYQWPIENVEKLLEALKDSSIAYSIGNMFVWKETQTSRKYQIIDGQQRFTTLVLICSVIRHIFETKFPGYEKPSWLRQTLWARVGGSSYEPRLRVKTGNGSQIDYYARIGML
jgi:hypothetical protein